MFLDSNNVETGSVFESDVCVVGAGAAGITLALALAHKGLDVTLVESGGFEQDPRTQDLYNGLSVGIEYPVGSSRLRYFGGTTNVWGGLCRPLDEWDFTVHPWMEHSGWPITKRDLDPYYRRALLIVDIPLPYPTSFSDLGTEAALYPPLLGTRNQRFESLLWLRSPPTRFGQKYRQEISRSQRIRCFLHANALQLEANVAGTLVTCVAAATLGGRHLRFRSRQYVLSAGGIENPRLLLLSDSVIRSGLGNQHDLVGRYFMEHLGALPGKMVVVLPPGARGFQEEYVQQCAAKYHPGVESKFFGLATTARLKEAEHLSGFSVHVARVSPDDDPLCQAIGQLLTRPFEGLPAAQQHERHLHSYALLVVTEQAPNPESRVFLSTERDALGQRRVALRWQVGKLDTLAFRQSMRLFATELARQGRGRVRLAGPDEEEFPRVLLGGGHHIGTTRMSDDPRRGVTDRNGKVHGVANLYVAGSSLFPTSGYANPTLTVVALALRLADWLASTSKQ